MVKSIFRKNKIIAAIAAATLSFAALPAAGSSIATGEVKQRFSEGDYQFVVRALEGEKNKTPTQYKLLISALMNQDLDEAEEVADAFVEKYSDDYRAYHMHASVMGAQASSSIFSALGYAEKAKQSLEKAVEVAPDNIDVYKALMQFHLVAPSIAGGDTDKAKQLVEKIASLDSIEGQLAQARLLLSEDQQSQAIEIYEPLTQKPDSQIRARFALGDVYMQQEAYEKAFSTYLPFMTTTLPAAEENIGSATWQAYNRDMNHLLYGTYRIGLVAVKTGKHTKTGIDALQQYLRDLEHTRVDTSELPTKDWARLRLSELLINDEQIADAQVTLAAINESNDDHFNKTLKKLKRQIKKHI